jgi:hypothetical protein
MFLAIVSDHIPNALYQYPKLVDAGSYKKGFTNEVRAYKLFRTSNCKVVPLFLGSTQSLTAEYQEDTNVPQSRRLCGKQRAVMLEYLDGEMLLPCNATEEAMAKAIEYLERIHELSLLHGDVHAFGVGTPRNVMLLKNGDVKWIDFEHSQLGAQTEDLEEERAVVQAAIGPKGLLWRRRYVFLVVCDLELSLKVVM